MVSGFVYVRSKVTHGTALVMGWFWFQYATDLSFRNGVTQWVDGLHPLYRGLFGALISFFMWYRNPNRKEQK